MANHRFPVRDVVRETPRAIVLRLETGGAPLTFAAGQAALVGLAGRAERKPYSIASSPEEQRQRGVVEFLVEVDSDGQARPNLDGLAHDSLVDVEGPVGGFVLPTRLPRELLFVAGGTGIATLRAMIASALVRRRPPSMTLVYSARTPADFAYGRELLRLSRQRRLRLCRTVTRDGGNAWRGRRGRIQQQWINALVGNRMPLCFVCGPEPFVASMIDMLRLAGVPTRRIRRERYQ